MGNTNVRYCKHCREMTERDDVRSPVWAWIVLAPAILITYLVAGWPPCRKCLGTGPYAGWDNDPFV
jgi:hypothetical protein